MTFLPTKLEFTTASAESSFVFEFSSPDARSNFEQAFEDAKKKLGQAAFYYCYTCDWLSQLILCLNGWCVFGFSHEQGPVGPRVPEGYSHHEDTQWDAGKISTECEDEQREEMRRRKIQTFFFLQFPALCHQFSCASPSHCCPDSGCEVWVCNSDGYVGQVRNSQLTYVPAF